MPVFNHRSLGVAAGAVLISTIAASGVVTAASAAAAPAPTGQRVIIELAASPALTRLGEASATASRDGSRSERRSAAAKYRTLAASITANQTSLVAAARNQGVTISKSEHVVGVLNAIIGTVDPSDLSALRKLPGVARVTVDTQLHLLEADPAALPAAVSPTPAAGPEVTPAATPAPTPQLATPRVKPTAAATSPASTTSPAPSTSIAPDDAPVTAADAALGAGITVAILDTGIDYTLPDLGEGLGAGHKVVGGYDFVNDDADPMDDHYHGTHVAGIVAGTGAQSVTGVAPEATLAAYKVLDETGSGELSGILLGLDAAADPSGAFPADVINMSLGGDGDGTDVLSEAAATATRSGSLVVAAAGNSGPDETTIGSPAAAPEVLSVGASITDFRLATATLVAPTKRALVDWRILMSANAPARDVTADIVDVGTGSVEEFDAAGDVRGKIVVYKGDAPRSTLEYLGDALTTARLAEDRGAIAALVWDLSPLDEANQDSGGGPVRIGTRAAADGAAASSDVDVAASGADALASGDDTRMDSLVMFGMSASEYSTFRDSVADGAARMTISSTDATDRIAAFSSRGPTQTGAIKPEVVAPGYAIRSTVPAAQEIPGNVFRLSGTSMATPNVAGSAAIVRAQHPELTTAQVRALLIGSAVPLVGASANLSPSTKGAGRVNVPAATDATVIASPATLGFGQANAVGSASTELSLDLSNLGDSELTARLEIQPSEDSVGKLALDDEDIVIGAGESTSVGVTATAKVGAEDSELSGVIIVRLSDGTQVRVPYLQSSRHLEVKTTPDPSTGVVQLMVNSFLPLDDEPTLTITPVGGKPFAVATTESVNMPGWYQANLAGKKIGVYKVAASAKNDGHSVAGTGSFEVISSATSATNWQQLGRNASSKQLEPSPVKSGVAMQISETSVRPFATTNFGKTWRQVRSLPVADGAGELFADSKKANSFWYIVNGAPGRPAMDPSYAGKMLHTSDLGKTWTVQPMPDTHYLAFTGSGSSLAVVVADGINISTNGGKTWSHIAYVWSDSVTDVAVQGKNLLVSGMTSVVRIKNVFGKAATPETVYDNATASISTIATDSTMVIAAQRHGGVLISTNGGTSWKSTAFDPEDFGVAATILRGEIFIGGLQGYFRSTTKGKTWKSVKYPVYGPVATDFDTWPGQKKSLLLPLAQAGLYSSTNSGKTFKRIGVPATSVQTVLASTNAAGKPTVYVADEQGVGSRALPTTATLKSTTTEWGATGGEAHIGVQATEIEQDATNHAVMWRTRLDAFFNTTLQGSVDGGKSWENVGPSNLGSIYDLDASQTVAGHVASTFSFDGETGVAVTHDGWEHWEIYSQPMVVRGVAIDPHNDSRLWLATDDGLYRSDDEGHTVTKVLSGEMSTVWVDPANANRVLAGGRGLWTSSDGGATFIAADAGGADMYIKAFAGTTIPGTKKGTTAPILFAGSATYRPGPLWVSGRGVLASLDGGLTWKNISAGMGSTSVLSLSTSVDKKWLLVGVQQGGVYRASVASLAKAAR